MEARHRALRNLGHVVVAPLSLGRHPPGGTQRAARPPHRALRTTRRPAPIAAVVLGGGLVVIDSLLADRGEAREAREAAKALEAHEAVKPAEVDASEHAPDPTPSTETTLP